RSPAPVSCGSARSACPTWKRCDAASTSSRHARCYRRSSSPTPSFPSASSGRSSPRRGRPASPSPRGSRNRPCTPVAPHPRDRAEFFAHEVHSGDRAVAKRLAYRRRTSMDSIVPELRRPERRELIRIGRKSSDPDTANRFAAVAKLAAARRPSKSQVARELEVAISTVVSAARRFVFGGVEQLYDQRIHNGRARKIDESFRQHVS